MRQFLPVILWTLLLNAGWALAAQDPPGEAAVGETASDAQAIPAETAGDGATNTGNTGREGATSETDDEPQRPLIERSLVLAPEQVGELRLVDMHRYPQVEAGIGLRYQHERFPDVRIDLFVYALGRAPAQKALEWGMQELRGQIDHAAGQGVISGVRYGEQQAVDLRRIDVDGSQRSPDGDPAGAPGQDAGADPPDAFELLQAMMELEGKASADDPDRGQRLSLTLAMGEEALHSRAYLFYRGLYLFKGRISASGMLLPGENLDRFSDLAMAQLVPLVQVRSTGGCARQTVYVDPSSKDRKDLVPQLVAANLRSRRENCAPTLDETVPAGFRAEALVYPPGMWAK